MNLKNFVSTTFLIALLTVVLFVGVWQINPAEATASFASGWEYSAGSDITDTGKWNGTHWATSYLSVNATTVKSGTYSLCMNNSDGASVHSILNYMFTARDSLYIAFDWYCTALPTAVGKMVNIGGVGTATHSYLFNIGVVYTVSEGAVWRLWNEQYNTGTNGTTGPSINTWYRLIFNASNVLSDKMSLWVDTALTLTSTWVNGANQQFTTLSVGSLNTGGGYGSNFVLKEFFDNVALGASYADVETWADYSAPTFSVQSTNTTKVSTVCLFACNISDDVEVDFGIFGTNNTGQWVNETEVDISAVSAWLNVTKTLNDTAGNVVQYIWYANDTNNNWASSALQSLTLDSGIYYLTINSLPVSVSYTINGTVSGASVTASSGSPSDIQTAIDTIVAAGGGTVNIPAGDFTFNPPVNGIGVTIPFTNVPINIIGAGIGVTNLTETINSGTSSTMFKRTWSGQNYNASVVRFSGISFNGFVINETVTSNTAIYLSCTKDFRIDHCAFYDFAGFSISVNSNTGGTYHLSCTGLIDHITIDNPYKARNFALGITSEWAYGIGVFGWNWNWQPLTDLLGKFDNPAVTGTVVYVEDSVFSSCRYAVTSNMGGYYVARYNTVNISPYYGSWAKAAFDVHEGSSPSVGGRGLEAYNNTILGAHVGNEGFKLRCGGGVIFNNSFNELLCGVYLYDLGDDVYHTVSDLYIWDNVYLEVTSQLSKDAYYIENTHYWLSAYSGYVSYAYPHPLAAISGTTNDTLALAQATYSIAVPSQIISGGYTYDFSQWQDASTSTTILVTLTANTTITATYVDVSVVTVIISSPTNTTYTSSTILISFTASGGTIHQKWFNLKNGTIWVYAENQTYPDYELVIGVSEDDDYTLYAWANNTEGTVGVATVMFSVSTEYIVSFTEWGGYWGHWWGYP